MSYPDDFTPYLYPANPDDLDTLGGTNPKHSQLTEQMGDDIERIIETLGFNPEGSFPNVVERLDAANEASEAAVHSQESLSVVAAAGAAETLDIGVASVFDVTLDVNVTFTFAGAVADKACSFTLILRQDGAGTNTVTWPASVDWPGGVAPTLLTNGSNVSVLSFLTVDNGVTWLGFLVADAIA